MDLDIEKFKESYKYIPESGLFVDIGANERCGHKKVWSDIRQYWYLSFEGISYSQHRLAFFYMEGRWPKAYMDHINGDTLDNSWANLREATATENQRNRRIGKNNKTGIFGFYKRSSYWMVFINHAGKKLYLGKSECFFEACCLRKSAENKYGYHPNHGCSSKRIAG